MIIKPEEEQYWPNLRKCKFCGYKWLKRYEAEPMSCPACKKRFDYQFKRKKVEAELQHSASKTTMEVKLLNGTKDSGI